MSKCPNADRKERRDHLHKMKMRRQGHATTSIKPGTTRYCGASAMLFDVNQFPDCVRFGYANVPDDHSAMVYVQYGRRHKQGKDKVLCPGILPCPCVCACVPGGETRQGLRAEISRLVADRQLTYATSQMAQIPDFGSSPCSSTLPAMHCLFPQ